MMKGATAASSERSWSESESKQASCKWSLLLEVGNSLKKMYYSFVRSIKRLPEVVSIMQNVQPNKTSLVMGDETRFIYGERRQLKSISAK